MEPKDVHCAVITVSDGVFDQTREDTGGALAAQMLTDGGFTVVSRLVVPDEQSRIIEALVRYSDHEPVHLIVTTGGTGLAPRDVTPQATRTVCDYEVPGMAEAMRRDGLQATPYSMLSRQVVGVRKRTLIVNLPGSPNGVRDNLNTVLPVLFHGIVLLQGHRPH